MTEPGEHTERVTTEELREWIKVARQFGSGRPLLEDEDIGAIERMVPVLRAARERAEAKLAEAALAGKGAET